MTDTITCRPAARATTVRDQASDTVNSPTVGNTGTGFLVGTQEPAYVQQRNAQHEPAAAAEPHPHARGDRRSRCAGRRSRNCRRWSSGWQRCRPRSMPPRPSAKPRPRRAAEADAARIAAEQTAAEQEMSATELVNKVREEFQQQFDRAAGDDRRQQRDPRTGAPVPSAGGVQGAATRRPGDRQGRDAPPPPVHHWQHPSRRSRKRSLVRRETSNSIVGEFQNVPAAVPPAGARRLDGGADSRTDGVADTAAPDVGAGDRCATARRVRPSAPAVAEGGERRPPCRNGPVAPVLVEAPNYSLM